MADSSVGERPIVGDGCTAAPCLIWVHEPDGMSASAIRPSKLTRATKCLSGFKRPSRFDCGALLPYRFKLLPWPGTSGSSRSPVAMSVRHNEFMDRSPCGVSAITRSPDIQGGTPVFAGTRVPVAILFDSLEEGESLETFLQQHPSVTREQVLEVLESAKARVART